MSKYIPEEVDMLIKMFKSKLPAKQAESISKKPFKQPYSNFSRKPFLSNSKKPFLSKTERTIKFLDSRHKFFNPTKEMLTYIIGVAENSGLDPVLLAKMKEDLLTKR